MLQCQQPLEWRNEPMGAKSRAGYFSEESIHSKKSEPNNAIIIFMENDVLPDLLNFS